MHLYGVSFNNWSEVTKFGRDTIGKPDGFQYRTCSLTFSLQCTCKRGQGSKGALIRNKVKVEFNNKV